MLKVSDNKKKTNFAEKLFGAIGIGVSLYGLKKVIDRYIEIENQNVIDSDEYQNLIKIEKENYELVRGNGLFDYEKIKKNNEADEMFKEFLCVVESINEIPDKIFRISDIEKLIPYEKIDRENKKKYYDNIVCMLSDKSERDYFIFKDKQNLPEILTESWNLNNNQILIEKYLDERFIINPNYYLKTKIKSINEQE